MEDPLDTAAAKKKPAFAFWDRQRKDSHSTSPTMQRSSSSHHSAQPAAANTGLSGVQRLIQQYSQSSQTAASSSSSSALSPERPSSTSGPSPSSSRVSPSPFPPASSASTSSQTLDLLSNDDTTKQAEAEKAKRRRRLLQDQLRKRNSNRRSSGPININSNSATLLSDDDDEEEEEEEEDARIASESDSNPPSGSAPDSDAFHDASSRLVTPVKPPPSTAIQSRPRGAPNAPPRQSLEDTRPWLEFSPLLPDSELLESPGKQATPSFALLHRSTPSELSTPTSRSSSTTDPPLLTSSARPSPSRSNSASMHASDSPASPTGLGLAAATSYLSLNSPTHSSHPRAYRNTKLPPPRPSPQAPLPPPPSEASFTHPSPQPHAYSSRSAARPAPPIALSNDDGDVFGGQTLRSRSYSLEQEVASADAQQHQHQQQPIPPPDSAQTHAAAATSSSPSSSLAVPIIRQRSNSLQRTQPDDSASASRPPRSASSSSTKSIGAGRPRGFTVGAVPAPPPSLRGGAPSSAPNKSRPRSLLSNEILPLDLAEPKYASSTDARKALSMDIDRRTAPNRAFTSVSLSRGPSATSQAERDAALSSATTSTDRLQPDSTERRPSAGGRSRSGSSASLLQQVNSQPKSHASFVIAVVGHAQSGKSTVIKKGLRQFGLSKPHVLSEKVTSHSTVCVVDQEQRTIEVLEIDASVLLNGPSKRFAWPKFLPHIDAVILCYDAAEIASFRGMSELLENFAVANLSTVMLACKSEVHPKAVDPYYASDMACIYNVGLAECTVQSEEGKKRMRDCFSYLVKEVAKVRSGRSRRGTASTVPVVPAAAPQTPSQPLSSPTQPTMPSRTASATSHASSQADPADAAHAASLSPVVSADPRARGYSNASSSATRITTGGGESPGLQSTFPSDVKRDLASDASASAAASHDSRLSLRKMSSATAGSSTSDVPSLQSHDELGLHDSLHRAQMGLQNARATGGYVSIEELWDKLFHAAISRTDERFVTMFMVFYRGFATPLDLLRQMMERFDTLTAEDVADGLVHRFALIRLTSMLGDWVLDYPGDLSNAETHALLLRYHHRLLHHPDTVHTATQIQNAVEATARAPDLDALWSKAVNSDQTRHKGASAIAGDVDGGLSASHSSSSHLAPATASGNTSHDMLDGDALGAAHDRSDTHERTGSESSLVMPSDAGVGGRSRSASDLTTSSTEAPAALLGSDDRAGASMSSGVSSVSAQTQTSAGGSTTASGTATQASVSSTSTEALASTTGRALDQKAVLRSISNTLMEVDDEVIATELTRLEWAYFTAIQPRDLLRHILVPHDKRDGPVSRSISHFNYMSNWVCSMILAQGKTKHRARMLEKFFNIASILRHDNNYGSLNSVLGGLSKTAVHRLKHTRELLKGKAVNKAYQSLVRLMSNERSSAAYRLALENSEGPTIPYVGVHLQDILSISDGNPSKRAADGMIHWRKFSLMDEAVMAVARCQQYDRYIKPNAAVERLIVDVPVMDDEALYERSLMVEPRASAGPVAASKIKDLKTFLSNQTYSSSSFHA